jgi:heme/copper-type cytochrome/quinol oxidase subunit 4
MVRENMMLAVILDSFCINNFKKICGKEYIFAKVMAIWNFFTLDAPQTIIHLYFLIYINNEIPHADITVEISLFTSLISVCVVFFNVMMI